MNAALLAADGTLALVHRPAPLNVQERMVVCMLPACMPRIRPQLRPCGEATVGRPEDHWDADRACLGAADVQLAYSADQLCTWRAAVGGRKASGRVVVAPLKTPYL